jgi:hypothetical protein
MGFVRAFSIFVVFLLTVLSSVRGTSSSPPSYP